MAGPPPSSMADVAARAGVSISTVSRALRGSPLVSADTTLRVVQAAEDLHFAVSRAASSLASGKLDRIAVLLSGSLGSWFNGCLLDAIYAVLHERRQELLIYRTLSREQRDEFFATLPARRNADALIVGSLELTASPATALAGSWHAPGVRQPAQSRVGVDLGGRCGRSRGRRPAPGQPRSPPDRVRGVRPRPGRQAQFGEPARRLPPGHGGGQDAGPGPAGDHHRP